MIIRTFGIGGFGIFADQSVSGLPDGVTVFLGDNEAGKSTCLGFFRGMLYGFVKDALYPPLRGGDPGGSLLLETRRHGTLRLERRPGVRGGTPVLLRPDGERLDSALLDTLLGGTTREVYRSVYGFSLSELQVFDSLDDEKVRHALYGASFGTATRPVGQVLGGMSKAMDALFLERGQKQPLNLKLKELEAVQAELRTGGSALAAYEEASAQREAVQVELARLRTERGRRQAERNAMERQLALWEQLGRMRALEGELAAISPVVDSFPNEGVERLESLRGQLDERVREYETARSRVQRLATAFEALGMERHRPLLERQAEIDALAGEKGRYRELFEQLSDLRREEAARRAEVRRAGEELGAGWDAERIRGFDRSVFTRERIAQFGQRMTEAAAGEAAAGEALQVCERDAAEARAAHAEAVALVQRLGGGRPVGEEALLETLAARREHVQTLREELPRREQAHAIAGRELDADIAGLVPDWRRGHIRALDTSFSARESVAWAGRTLAGAEQELRDAEAARKLAAGRVAPLRERLEVRRAELNRFARGVTRQTMQERKDALRTLRPVVRKLEGVRLALAGMQAAEEAMEQAAAGGSGGRKAVFAVVMGAAALCGIAGGVLLSAPAWWPGWNGGQGVMTMGYGLLAACVLGAASGAAMWLYGRFGRPVRAMDAGPAERAGGVGAGLGVAAEERQEQLRAEAGRLVEQTRALAMKAGIGSGMRGAVRGYGVAGAAGPAGFAEPAEAAGFTAGSVADEARGEVPDSIQGRMSGNVSDSMSGKSYDVSYDDVPDDAALERAEIEIDLLRDEVHAREQVERAIAETEAEAVRAEEQAEAAARAVDAARNERDLARQAWAVRARELALPATATPEAALSIFDRVEGIRARLHTLDMQAEELAGLHETVGAYVAMARTLLADMGLEGAGDGMTDADVLRETVRVLDAAKAARESEKERARAEEALRERSALLTRREQALEEARERCRAAAAACADVEREWRGWLAGRGLAETLSPATAQAALETISGCVAQLDALDALHGKAAALEAGVEDFRKRLEDLLVLLPGGAQGRGMAGHEERLAGVDALVQALVAARTAQAEEATLRRELPGAQEAEQGLAAQCAVLEERRLELLALGGAAFTPRDGYGGYGAGQRADGSEGSEGPEGSDHAEGSQGADGLDSPENLERPDTHESPEGPAGSAGLEGPANPAGPAGLEGPADSAGPAGVVTLAQAEELFRLRGAAYARRQQIIQEYIPLRATLESAVRGLVPLLAAPEGAVTGAVTGPASGMASGPASGRASGQASGVASGQVFGVASNSASGSASDMAAGRDSGPVTGPVTGQVAGQASGMALGMALGSLPVQPDAARDEGAAAHGAGEGVSALDGLARRLAAVRREDMEARVAELAAQMEEDEARENGLRQQVSDLSARLEGLVSAGKMAELRGREQAVREDIRVLSRQWARLALARHLVLEAKRNFEAEQQPGVIRHASGFFRTITGGVYSGLHASLDDSAIRAVTAGGEVRDQKQLSRGTQEQLFLSLRLGYILSHSAQGEPLPVVMDDILVNFDPGRAARTAEALGELARHNQILYFTCHPQAAETLCRAVPDAAVYRVADGTFRAG